MAKKFQHAFDRLTDEQVQRLKEIQEKTTPYPSIANNDKVSSSWDNIVRFLTGEGRWRIQDDGSYYNKDVDISVMPSLVPHKRTCKWEAVLNIVNDKIVTVQSVREVWKGEHRPKRDQWIEPFNAPVDVQQYLYINRAFMVADKPILGANIPISMDYIRLHKDIEVKGTVIRFKLETTFYKDGITVFAPCVEGADCDGPSEKMEFPIYHDKLYQTIQQVEEKATEMWHEWNDEEGDQW